MMKTKIKEKISGTKVIISLPLEEAKIFCELLGSHIPDTTKQLLRNIGYQNNLDEAVELDRLIWRSLNNAIDKYEESVE